MTNTTADGYAEFRFFRPEASKVFVVGDFNDWRTDQLSMARADGGYWVLRLPLGPGDYRFRYVADGAWYTDFASFGVEPGRFGMDSILRVVARPLQIKVHAAEAPQTPSRVAVAAA